MIDSERERRNLRDFNTKISNLNIKIHELKLLPSDVNIIYISDDIYDGGCRGIERQFNVKLKKTGHKYPLYFEYRIRSNYTGIEKMWDFRQGDGVSSFIIWVKEGKSVSSKIDAKYIYSCSCMNRWVETFEEVNKRMDYPFTDWKKEMFNQLIPTLTFLTEVFGVTLDS